MVLPVCMFSGLTDTEWAIGLVYPGGRLLLLLPALQLPLRSIEDFWVFLYPVCHVHHFHSCSTHDLGSYWRDVVSVASNTTRSHSLSKVPGHLVLTVFPFPLLQCSQVSECFVGSEHHDSVFWLAVVFCNILHREISSMRGADYTYLWLQGQVFIDCCYELCCFSKLVVVDYPPKTMTSLSLHS